MIPKIIHYCWLSKDPIPTEARECIKSWRKYMPGWEIKLWNTDNFDVNSIPFVAEAVAARKWAFAADYIRCYALYTEGGIYLDSDVLVRKPMDFVLENQAFSAIECYPHLVEEIKKNGWVDEEGNKKSPKLRIHGIQIQAAILGSEPGHPFFKDCLEFYKRAQYFSEKNGVPSEENISPIIFANIAEKFGFKYLDQEQQLDYGFKLYPSSVFCPQPYLMKESAVAVHCCNASWRTNSSAVRNAINNVKIRIKSLLINIGLRTERNIDKIR